MAVATGPSKTDIITSGALYSLGAGFAIGSFTNQITSSFRYMQGAAQSVAYFVDGGGGGKFTPIVAAAAAEWIRSALLNESLADKRLGAGNWPKLAEHYEKAKRASGYKGHMGHLEGTMANSIGVYRRSTTGAAMASGHRMVSIDYKQKVTSYKITKGLLVPSDMKVSMAALVRRFEYGYQSKRENKSGSQGARPFMAAGINSFMIAHFGKWSETVVRALAKSAGTKVKFQEEKPLITTRRAIVTGDKALGTMSTEFTTGSKEVRHSSDEYESDIDLLFAKDGDVASLIRGSGDPTGERDKWVSLVTTRISESMAGGDPAIIAEIKQYAKSASKNIKLSSDKD